MAKHYFMGKGGSTRGVDPDADTNVIVEGVAATGQMADSGTVAHTEHWDGRVDANVTPKPVSMSLGIRQKG